ncbi:TlpA disulfide reductase family protein [Marinobacter sp. X15-166B]|uniref:TlpA disulfide reductase family protein n=1 Tax=Marinobacter sp. X15-166B TaxID=1897620 RepID=UPI00085C1794|nr:TlpA disulfide reductase family protein [Marinobacter sp. X15-166B]OEY67921.1 redoxin [Marinobacter sp. X15-166B]
MLSVSVGPLSLSLGQLLVMVAFVIALITGGLAGRQRQIPTASTLVDVFVVAMLSARLGFVVRYFDYYRDNLFGLIDIRDGGFDMVSGLIGTLAFTAWLLWRRPPIRRPLGIAVTAGLLSWGATFGLINLIDQQATAMPEVALTQMDGTAVQLSAVAAGQPRVVNLWATWCPPCVREMPVLEAAQQQYPEIAFVFVNQGEPEEAIRRFLDEQGLSLEHVYSDRSGLVGRQAGSQALPTTLFYDANGRLVDSHLGELSRATLAQGLRRFDAHYLTPSSTQE